MGQVKQLFNRRRTGQDHAAARWRRSMAAGGLAAVLVGFVAPAAPAADTTAASKRLGSGEAPQCRQVRFADVGWTDVTATTGLASYLLRELGYAPEVTVLSVPVTYASLRNKDIDIFLGNWMPAQEADRKPFLADGSIEVLDANLTEAKYTLAVPAYLHEQGLRDFADIARFAGPLNNTIYGIEPGNDGNRHVLEMIKANRFGLGGFKLIESSEQGMLAQVERAIAAQQAVVFLGWEPHPMNKRFAMRYLTGGDDSFGPNFGGATIYTNVRRGYLEECPNVGRFIRNLKFTAAIENELMDGILTQKLAPEAAAEAWLRNNRDAQRAWLDGVLTADGEVYATDAPQAARAETDGNLESWLRGRKIPLGAAFARAIDYVQTNFKPFFNGVSTVIGGAVNAVNALLAATPGPLLILLFGALAWFLHRSIGLALFVVAAFLFIMNQGYWAATLETIALVLVAALLATLLGVPLGIAAAHRPRLYAAIRPVLDLMQTLPTFVYLIPTLVLFGLGVVPGLISTVVFALPAPVRLTHLGISSVPRPLLEAGDAFGATPWQKLWKVELPSALPSILSGITQCIMLSLSMVVIAALVGAGGLGVPVVRALNSVQVDIGFEAGIAIVLLAIVLDRLGRPREVRRSR